jgi:regulator of sigma E protease
MVTFIAFIVILGIIIFVHELGHFLAAKICGVGVETFAFGFPPRIWSRKFKGTEYKINLIPFGGYVKLQGEGKDTEEVGLINVEKDKNRKTKNLFDVGTLESIFIFSAGVLMNILIAVLAVWMLYLVGFKPIELGQLSQKIFPGIDGNGGVESTLEVKVEEVEKDTPAAQEGLKTGDTILEVDGKKVYFAGEVVTAIQEVADENGAKVDLKVKSGSETRDVELSTYKSKVKDNRGQEHEINRIGILMNTTGEIQSGIASGLKSALITTGNIVKYTLLGIGDLFYKIFAKFQLSENIAGPIGVVAGTSYYAQLGISALVQFAVILSVGVALFNILPIPALDGGYVAFTIIESIIRKKIPTSVKNALTLGGFAALILLILIVTYRDFISFGVSNYLLKLIGK